MIYFVRHGETEYNLNKICAGQQDVPLNFTGIEQAKIVANQLKNVKLDFCYCSPLVRAKQTCEEILKYHNNLSPIYDSRLIERYYGKAQNQPTSFVIFNKWQLGENDQKIIDLEIEPILHMLKRVSSFYEEIKNKKGNILVVAHSGIGKITHAYFNGMPKNGDFSVITIPNASVVNFDFENKKTQTHNIEVNTKS